MEKLVIAIGFILSFCATTAKAEYVGGHYRNNGTYVNGYHRSSSDSTTLNNYSTKGNKNPYTGQIGTKNPDSTNSFRTNYGSRNSFGSTYNRY